ncbi:MAG: phage major capsid protein, partial [Bdellovibrionota bacterium]
MKLKKHLFRAMSADCMNVDMEKRTVDFSFSSEYPVDRWFGKEVLSHKAGAADLSRLNGGANLLWNHDPNQVLGVIESAEIRGGKGYVTARFSKSPDAEQKLQDIQDGILRNVSFGYQVQELERTKSSKESGDEYTATKWQPFEVSVLAIPADPNVGIGRASSGDEEIEVTITNSKGETRKMETTAPTVDQGKIEADRKASEQKIRTEAMEAERVRAAAIRALGDKFERADLARQLVESGKSVDEARAAVLESLGVKQVPLTGNEAVLGMSEKELRKYSFMRMLNAMANPNDRSAQEAAKFERELSDAAAVKGGKSARGMIVPVDVLRQRRDLTVGTSTAGGDLVKTDLLSGSFIELLRNKSVVQAAGATVMNGLVGNVSIPKQGSAATAYWVAESGAPTESQQAVAQLSMSPKTVAAFTDYSRKLLLQSSIDVENFIRGDLAAVLALEIDRAALYGLGSSNQPQGLKPALAAFNTASQEENFAAATPTFAEVVGLESKITAANGDIGSMKYLVNASMQGALKSAPKVSGYPVYILENGSMNGYPVMMSNQIASGDVFFGVWSQLILAFWSGLDILVDP